MSSGYGLEDSAVKELQQADLWWNAFQEEVSKYRAMAVCYLAYSSHLRVAERDGLKLNRVMALRYSCDYAHDMLLSIQENVDTLARSAVSCEMASRIYFEAQEQRNWDE